MQIGRASKPADAADLADRGRLAKGARDDVNLVTRIGEAAALRGVWVYVNRVS